MTGQLKCKQVPCREPGKTVASHTRPRHNERTRAKNNERANTSARKLCFNSPNESSQKQTLTRANKQHQQITHLDCDRAAKQTKMTLKTQKRQQQQEKRMFVDSCHNWSKPPRPIWQVANRSPGNTAHAREPVMAGRRNEKNMTLDK